VRGKIKIIESHITTIWVTRKGILPKRVGMRAYGLTLLSVCIPRLSSAISMKLGPKSPTGFSSNFNPDDPWAQIRNGMDQEFN